MVVLNEQIDICAPYEKLAFWVSNFEEEFVKQNSNRRITERCKIIFSLLKAYKAIQIFDSLPFMYLYLSKK